MPSAVLSVAANFVLYNQITGVPLGERIHV